jgi:hypothetical protein
VKLGVTESPAEVDDDTSPDWMNLGDDLPGAGAGSQTEGRPPQVTPSVATEECFPHTPAQNSVHPPSTAPMESQGTTGINDQTQSLGQRKGNKTPSASALPKKKMPQNADKNTTTKAGLAAAYAEKCKEKSQFRSQLIGSKEKWKSAELEERKQARLHSGKSERLDRALKMRMEEFVAFQAEKRQRTELNHQILMAEMSQKTTLLTELIRSNKSEDEISRLMKLVGPHPTQSTHDGNDFDSSA